MRSREELIIHLGARLYAGSNNLTDANCEAQRYIDEAIQRGRELERAEMGRDTERLDWVERQIATELSRFDEGWVLNTDLTCQAYDQATARAAIDAAMNAENGNG